LDFDDALAEKYLDGKPISIEKIKAACAKAS
jgi:hypothetical protein